jgi:putative ABC transport system permease protein
MDALLQNLRYAVRALLRTPGFTTVAVLTLALGIGATTAIYAVLHSVVLSPLPYTEPGRLVRIENRVPGFDPERNWGLSPAGYFHFREHSRTLEEIGVYTLGQQNLTGDGPAERVHAAHVSAGVLSLLRARPLHGRLIGASDDRPAVTAPGVVAPGPAEPVAMLSHDFWVRRFGADPGVVGRTIEVNGAAVPVIGVLEPGFRLPDPGSRVDVWTPLGLNPAAHATNWHSFQGVGRLRDGVTAADAEAELRRFTAAFPEIFPDAYPASFFQETGFAPVVTSLRDFVVGDLGRTLWILMAAVGLVLLIACANVANLFLVRTEGRGRELAIRSAVGAGRGHLTRQFVTEGLVLALLGGAAGLGLANLGVSALLWSAPEGLPRLEEVRVGDAALGFAALLSLTVGVLVGLLPLLRFGAHGAASVLQDAGRGSTAGYQRSATRDLLVVGQVAMALVLLAAAGLLLQSFRQLRAVDPGFDPAGVLTLELTLTPARYPGYEPTAAFHEELLSRVEALPGAQRAAVATTLPLDTRGVGCASVFLEDRPLAPGAEPPCVGISTVSPGFFEALRIPVSGDAPGWAEIHRRSGEVVVTRALAERLWPGQDPIGKGIRGNGPHPPFYRVPDRGRPARRAGGAAAAAEGRGLRDRDGGVAGGRAAGGGVERLRRVLMDLNYTRDTTSGKEGLRAADQLQELDSTLPVVVMTAWGSIQRRGGGDAPRRARLHREAVGQRSACSRCCARRCELGRALRESERLESRTAAAQATACRS